MDTTARETNQIERTKSTRTCAVPADASSVANAATIKHAGAAEPVAVERRARRAARAVRVQQPPRLTAEGGALRVDERAAVAGRCGVTQLAGERGRAVARRDELAVWCDVVPANVWKTETVTVCTACTPRSCVIASLLKARLCCKTHSAVAGRDEVAAGRGGVPAAVWKRCRCVLQQRHGISIGLASTVTVWAGARAGAVEAAHQQRTKTPIEVAGQRRQLIMPVLFITGAEAHKQAPLRPHGAVCCVRSCAHAPETTPKEDTDANRRSRVRASTGAEAHEQAPLRPHGVVAAHASHTKSHGRAASGRGPAQLPVAARHCTVRVSTPAAVGAPSATSKQLASQGCQGPTVHAAVAQRCVLHGREGGNPWERGSPHAATQAASGVVLAEAAAGS